jgi:hypothetical protein
MLGTVMGAERIGVVSDSAGGTLAAAATLGRLSGQRKRGRRCQNLKV